MANPATTLLTLVVGGAIGAAVLREYALTGGLGIADQVTAAVSVLENAAHLSITPRRAYLASERMWACTGDEPVRCFLVTQFDERHDDFTALAERLRADLDDARNGLFSGR